MKERLLKTLQGPDSPSDPNQAPAPPKVGYGNPPSEHRFKKGTSGNPRGRPPKRERSFTRRQSRRDVLSIGETPTIIRTEKGTTTVTAIEAILMRAKNKALAGHGPSIRLMIKLYFEMVAEHDDAHDRMFSFLESDERLLTFHADHDTDDPQVVAFRKKFLEAVNRKRKATRRT